MKNDRFLLYSFFTSILTISIVGCDQDPNRSEDMPQLYIVAKQVQLDTEEGYTVNPFTEDNIIPLLDISGEPLITGKELPIQREVISYDSSSLQIIDMKVSPEVVECQTNTFDLGVLKGLRINKDLLDLIPFGEGDKNYELKNNIDSVILTGRPIPFRGVSEKAVLAPLIELDKMEESDFPDFGKAMSIEKGYDLVSSNIVEDKKGNLWTGYENLMRNDGVYIQTYFQKNQQDNRIENLMIDSKDNIWFSNSNRRNSGYFLCKFDGHEFTYYTSKTGLFFSEIGKIYEDSDSAIWVGMNGGILLKIEGEQCTYITPREGMLPEKINDIAEGKDKEMWFATEDGAINLRDRVWTRYPLDTGDISTEVYKIHKDIDENLWFGTNNGISILKRGSIIAIDTSNGLLGNPTYEIASNDAGDVMVGTLDGVSILNLRKNNISHVIHLGPYLGDGAINYAVESITSDRAGNFWMNYWGTMEYFSGRVNYVRDKSLGNVRFVDENGVKITLLPNEKYSISMTNQPRSRPGFAVKDSHNLYYSLKDISNAEWVYDIAKTKEDYWFLSYTGLSDTGNTSLFHFNEKRYTDFSMLLDHFKNGIIETVFVDSKGAVWLAGLGNLIKYESGIFEEIKFPGVSDQLNLWSVYEDSKGDMWFGTVENGIIKLSGESYTIYSQKEGLSGNVYTQAVEDKNGSVWISNNNGIDKFDHENFHHYSADQGFRHEGIIDLINDTNGNIWALADDPEEEERTLYFILVDSISEGEDKIYSFTYSNLESDFFGDWLMANNLDSLDHNIYAPGISHIPIENYDSIAVTAPVVQLNNILINDQFYDFQNTTIDDSLGFSFDGTAPFYNYPENLELGYENNHVTFSFSATEWKAPDKILYIFKLEGSDYHWSTTNETTVDYRGLSPGNYTFKLYAFGESQKWSPLFEYDFQVASPWWSADLTKMFYCFVGILLLIIFIRWRVSKFRKRQIQLEEEVNAATSVILAQKEEVEKQHSELLEAYKKLEIQKRIVEAKNREITNSIVYAKRLQNAILPSKKLVREWLNDSFIFYKPKDIVAGDFYWMEVTRRNGRNVIFYAAGDCTGHGVPGAMVSVVCSNALNQAIKEFKINDPAILLDTVSKLVQQAFAQSDETIRDGMDIAICAVDLVERKMWFAGANNPLYRITDADVEVPEELEVMLKDERKLVEYKADKQAIGDPDFTEPFHTKEIQLLPGDCVYIFSDGFADQFGGDSGKKYRTANFKKFLLEIESQSMDSQREILDFEIEHWKGEYEQVDDICVIGLRINGQMRKIFTERELEVIQKISEGKPSKIIAAELNITKNTVDTHRKRIMAKTNAHNSTELINFCKVYEIL